MTAEPFVPGVDPIVEPAPEEPHIKPFADWLAHQRRGVAAQEWAEGLVELEQACELHQKAGTVTFTVKITPTGGGAFAVTDAIKVTPPKADPEPSLFFGDKHGNLVRTDPRQQVLGGIREVPTRGDS